MKKLLLIVIALSTANISSGQSLTESLNWEISYIQKIRRNLAKDSTKSWYKIDNSYYENWQNGLTAERRRNFQEAIDFYEISINTNRGEVPSYNPKFSKGRALIKLGLKAQSKECLTEFVAFAESEISGESPYQPNEEFKSRLLLQIEMIKKEFLSGN